MKLRRQAGRIGASAVVWSYAALIVLPTLWVLSNAFNRY